MAGPLLQTRSNSRLASYMTICVHAYFLVVIQWSKFAQILLNGQMYFASLYTNEQKLMYRKFDPPTHFYVMLSSA